MLLTKGDVRAVRLHLAVDERAQPARERAAPALGVVEAREQVARLARRAVARPVELVDGQQEARLRSN